MQTVIVLSLLAAGLFLFFSGIKVRRHGDTPFCSQCGYNLTGATAHYCPECGGDILATGGTVHGLATRRPRRAVLGGIVAVLMLTILIAPLTGLNTYPYLPASWIIQEIKTQHDPTAQRAWNEIDRRLQAGRLKSRHHKQLIDIYLDRQRLPLDRQYAAKDKLYDYMEYAFQHGLLTPPQHKRLFEQMVEAKLEVRPRTSPKDAVQGKLSYYSHNHFTPMAFLTKVESQKLNGEDCNYEINAAWEGAPNSGSIHGHVDFGRLSPGQYTFSGTLQIAVYASHYTTGISYDDWKGAVAHFPQRPCYAKTQIPISVDFEVLEEEDPDYISKVKDPKMPQRVQENFDDLRFNLVRDAEGNCSIRRFTTPSLSRSSPTLPTNVTASLFLCLNHQKILLGHAIARKGDKLRLYHYDINHHFHYTGPAEKEVELILRSDEQVARNTIDLYEIWDGPDIRTKVRLIWQRDDYQSAPASQPNQ